MNIVKETVKNINIVSTAVSLILLILCYALCHTFLITVVKFLPWFSIPILIGCILYIFVSSVVGWIIWTFVIAFVISKSLVDMTNDSDRFR